MITHEEARERTLYLHGKYDEAYKTLNDYISQQEQFAKDVARYFELRKKADRFLIENDELYEYWILKEKFTNGVAK